VGDIHAAIDSKLVLHADYGPFTHVHILAHGDKASGLHFSGAGESRTVSGQELAMVVRALRRTGESKLAEPAVVTIASCDSANMGTVIGPGASVAHVLHEYGVPIVIGSQFPLSVRGSVLFVELLYEGLLWGNDPRIVVSNLRRRLRAELSETHDWASIVVYATLPPDFEQQMVEVRFEQTKRAIDAALHRTDFATDEWWYGDIDNPNEQEPSDHRIVLERLEDVALRLESLGGELQARAEVNNIAAFEGLRASMLKREAEYRLQRELMGQSATDYQYLFFDVEGTTANEFIKITQINIDTTSARSLLRKSLKRYAEVFKADKSQVWAVVQHLALAAALGDKRLFTPDAWMVAFTLSRWDLDSSDRRKVDQAHANLLELYVLAERFHTWDDVESCRPQVVNLDGQNAAEVPRNVAAALDHADKLVRRVDSSNFILVSTRRQLKRYLNLFAMMIQPAPTAVESWTDAYRPVVDLVAQLLNRLPVNPRYEQERAVEKFDADTFIRWR
jgi:hypothetical protein